MRRELVRGELMRRELMRRIPTRAVSTPCSRWPADTVAAEDGTSADITTDNAVFAWRDSAMSLAARIVTSAGGTSSPCTHLRAHLNGLALRKLAQLGLALHRFGRRLAGIASDADNAGTSPARMPSMSRRPMPRLQLRARHGQLLTLQAALLSLGAMPALAADTTDAIHSDDLPGAENMETLQAARPRPLANPDALLQLQVRAAYVELHSGPGRGFPVISVIERGEPVLVVQRRTDWFQLRAGRERLGWVHRDQFVAALSDADQPITLAELDQDAFRQRTLEAGVLAGDFGGASSVSLYGSWHFTENLSLELGATQALGNYSDQLLFGVQLLHQAFPEWRYSPYLLLGTGVLRTSPHGALVQTEDRDDNVAQIGVGLRSWISERFVLRIGYTHLLVLTERNENEKVETWQAGFSVFF